MSYTEIFAFNKEGNAYMAGMARNAWRGAMTIWNIMEERHLPPYIPEYVKLCNWYHPGMTAEEIEAKNGFKPRRTAPTLGKTTRPAKFGPSPTTRKFPGMSASSCLPPSTTAW